MIGKLAGFLPPAVITAIMVILLLAGVGGLFVLGRAIGAEGAPVPEQPEPYNASIALPPPPNLGRIPRLRARSPLRHDGGGRKSSPLRHGEKLLHDKSKTGGSGGGTPPTKPGGTKTGGSGKPTPGEGSEVPVKEREVPAGVGGG